MKRDWELVRQILLQLEALGDTRSILRHDGITGYDADNVGYHMRLLKEAGLIEAECITGLGGRSACMASGLTWHGHELLDHMREQGMWNNVRRVIREKGLEVSIEAIKLAGHLVVQRLFQA